MAFLLGAVAAVFSVYSYAKMGTKYPSSGGATNFINVGFGPGTVAGGLNVFQYLAYLIATALYGAGFSEYVAALAGEGFPTWGKRLVAVGVVVLLVLINVIGAGLVTKAESGIIATELVIIAALIVLGALFLALGGVTLVYLAVSTLVVMLAPVKKIVADSGVGQMASLGFLLLYGSVSVGHLRVRSTTGARAWPLYAAIAINAVRFVMLFINAAKQSPASAIVMAVALAGSFAFEAAYRRKHASPA